VVTISEQFILQVYPKLRVSWSRVLGDAVVFISVSITEHLLTNVSNQYVLIF